MTTNAKPTNEKITAMGLFRDGLDYDIKMKETRLRANLEGLRREIDRAIANRMAATGCRATGSPSTAGSTSIRNAGS